MTDETLTARVVKQQKGRGGTFLLDAALEASPGVTVIAGPSGAGKTTLLAAIAGLVRPEQGRVALGADVWFDAPGRIDRPTHHRPLAMVLQTAALFPHMSVLANVEYGVDRALPRAERRARAMSLLEQMSAALLAARRPASLSGGEAQRVAVARALARAPRVLLFDEPFGALDRDLRRALGVEVRARISALGVPALFVTHDRDEALLVGDRAVRLDGGRVVAAGPVADVLA